MPTIAAIVLAASQMLFEAEVPTFGCNSGAEVSNLQSVRSDTTVFQDLLTAQVSYGQCVTIPQSEVVEGSTDDAQPATLLINAKSDPPSYRVPSKDFKRKEAGAAD